MNIYVTGQIGSDRKKLAKQLAEERQMPFFDMDEEIVAADGRSLLRICMMMGEHAYRNKEFELLKKIENENYVCACSDAILFDPDCEEIVRKGEVVIADADLSADELWEKAKLDKDIPYAFIAMMRNEELAKEKYMKLFELRKEIYGLK